MNKRNAVVLTISILNFLVMSSSGLADEHAGAGAAGTSRPGAVRTGSEDQYSQIMQFADAGKDTEMEALVDGKFTLKGDVLSTKFKNWMSEIEKAHGKIWKDCKEKSGAQQLNELLKSYATAVAEEIGGATRTDTSLIKSDSKKPVLRAERLYSLTKGVREILAKQVAEAPSDKKDRLKKQNEELLSMMDKSNAFLAGADATTGSKKEREEALAKIKLASLSEIGIDGLKVDTASDSLQSVIDDVEPGQLCWFDDVAKKLPPGAEFVQETKTTTEVTQQVVHTDDAPKTAYVAPEVPKTGQGYSGGYTAPNYNQNVYPKNYKQDYDNSSPTYTPSLLPYSGGVSSPKSYTPPAAAPAVGAPAAAAVPATPLLGGGGFGIGFGYQQQQYPPVIPYIPPTPVVAPLPVVGYEKNEVETETVTSSPATAIAIPMPMAPPPPPPTIVNDVNVVIRIRQADGTVTELPPGTPIPAGATVISSPNPYATGTGTGLGASTNTTINNSATQNVNSIANQIQNVNSIQR